MMLRLATLPQKSRWSGAHFFTATWPSLPNYNSTLSPNYRVTRHSFDLQLVVVLLERLVGRHFNRNVVPYLPLDV